MVALGIRTGGRRPGVAAVTRDDIVAAAATAFRRNGYRGATLNDIAKLVGIQKASLYHHISSKEELLLEILEAGLNPSIEGIEPIVVDPTLSQAEKLAAAVRAHVLALTSSMDNHAVFIQDFDAISDVARREAYLNRRRHYERLLRGLVADCLDAHGRPDDPKLVTLALLGMCNDLVRWFHPGGDLRADEIAEGFGRLAVEMVGGA